VISRLWKSSVFWAFCSTALRLGGFIFVLPFALRRLSPEHLGIWYTMQSLSSLVILMEAGFSPCISRFASFYFAGARKVPSLGLKTEPADHEASPNLSALAGLVLMARRLYRIFGLGALVFMTVGGGGWLAWKFGPIFLRADVFSAYLLYAMGIAVMMSGFFWADLLFGVQQVRESYYNTIAALILNYVVTIVLFKLGCGLLSLAMGQIIMTLLPRWLGRRRFLRLFPIGEVKQPQFIAIKELWPMCWRSGLSAFAAYLLLRNITLVAADVLDLHVTASLGLSLQFSLALAGVSQIWLVVKYPVISALRVKKDEKALRRVVRQRIPLCLVTYAVGATAFLILGPWAIHLMGSRTQLLPTPIFALLFLVTGLDLFMGSSTAIMLTENRVSFLLPFFISGIITAVAGFIFGHLWGIVGIILSPAIVQVFWNYWWAPLASWRSLTLNTANQIQTM
jgi:O-antigen/teichoic acid export membrane protein